MWLVYQLIVKGNETKILQCRVYEQQEKDNVYDNPSEVKSHHMLIKISFVHNYLRISHKVGKGLLEVLLN